MPTALKIQRGNPGKQKLPQNEPSPPKAAPQCPKFLDADAKVEWKRIVPLLMDLGCLALMDRAALAAYCACYSRWANAEEKLAETQSIVAGEMGEPVKNPWLAVRNNELAQMKGFLVEFGMTPSSRTRVQTTATGSNNPKSRFFS